MIKLFQRARDPWSSYTHFIGAILSLLTLFLTIFKGITHQVSLIILIGCIIFNLSMLALYTASSLYHYVNAKDIIIKRLRKLDHAMIYILIVGTYTPIVLRFMQAPHAYYFLAILWIIAFIGICIKMFWLNAPRILSTVIYLLLGWAIIFDMKAFVGIPISCLILIALGGIAYSIGAIIYMIKKPNISKVFGFHELFHIFVLIGSLLHYLSIYLYVL